MAPNLHMPQMRRKENTVKLYANAFIAIGMLYGMHALLGQTPNVSTWWLFLAIGLVLMTASAWKRTSRD